MSSKVLIIETQTLQSHSQSNMSHLNEVTTNALFISQAQTPTRQPTNTRQPTPTAQPSSLYAVGYVTPEFINRYYNVSSNTGTLQVSQAVYETNYKGYSPSDLTMFQNTFGLPLQSPIELGSFFKYHNCTYRDCYQGNLDLQYIMGIAQNIDTTYYYSPIDQNDFLSNWITSVSNTATPANVYNIGWRIDELYVSKSFMNLFNTEAIKLGVMGTTILASSGIDGVLSNYARRGSSYCGYVPGFPASSPYVVAVGGTNGPQSNQPEVACQSGIWSNSSFITSGGGFSNVYSQPSWQAPAVKDYLNLVTGTSKQPSTSYKPSIGINVGSFNAIGRAYPDVALLANNYKIVVNGRIKHLDGTSASVVVMAAFVSLVNAQRKSKGMSTMGLINPFLYKYYANFTNDITSGDNKCSTVSKGIHTCCKEGFFATEGWDPVTGLGSINFDKFLATAMSVPIIFNTWSPTASPISPPPATLSITLIIITIVVVGSIFLAILAFYSGCIRSVINRSSRNTNDGQPAVPTSPAVAYSEVVIYDGPEGMPDSRAMSARQEREISAEMVTIVDGRRFPTAQAAYSEVSVAQLVKTEDMGGQHYYTAAEKVVADNNKV